MTPTQALATLSAIMRGERPMSLSNPETEEVLSIALTLLVELAVTNDRVDRLERAVAALSGQPLEHWREAPLPPEAEAGRAAATDALMARALKLLADNRQPVDGRP